MASLKRDFGKKGKLSKIITDLKNRTQDLEELKEEISWGCEEAKCSPSKSKELIEEIIVPHLDILKESKKK